MPFQFSHAPALRARFAPLRCGVLLVEPLHPGAHTQAETRAAIARFSAQADQRLAAASEGLWPEVQAWRRAFADMGLKPTQYRCAAEALLRRYRKEGALPALHPLIDLCNAASLAFAIPVAVFDVDRITPPLTVRPAQGDERYDSFAGEVEHPEPGEVIFADAAGRAHARRWTHRQSGWSAVRADTHRALIVAEALHDTAAADVAQLMAVLGGAIRQAWPGCGVHEVLAP